LGADFAEPPVKPVTVGEVNSVCIHDFLGTTGVRSSRIDSGLNAAFFRRHLRLRDQPLELSKDLRRGAPVAPHTPHIPSHSPLVNLLNSITPCRSLFLAASACFLRLAST